jgi:tRNA(His) guanylyltransferase
VKTDDLEERMRELEWFHDLRVLPTAWTVIRVDGRGFTKLSERHFERPFDVRFHDLMMKTAEALLVELHGVFAFSESDEISVLLPADTQLFDREVEKLVSISAGIASATFALGLGSAAHFDSRVWVGPSRQHVLDYFRWRQSDAARCCLNGWCYWTLRKEGQSVQQATGALEGKSFADKNELLFSRGINFNDVPQWQKHGVGVYWERFEKTGLNPLTGDETRATRRRVRLDKELPRGAAFTELVARLLEPDADSPQPEQPGPDS